MSTTSGDFLARDDQHGIRRMLASVTLAVFGCLLFAASRKLVWGRNESLADIWLWALAALPYAMFFAGRQLGATSRDALAFLKSADFLAIWTVSLLTFVILRATGFSDLFEDSIYSLLRPGAARYAVLSVIYIGLGWTIVTASRMIGTRTRTYPPHSIGPRAASFLASILLFFAGIFAIQL